MRRLAFALALLVVPAFASAEPIEPGAYDYPNAVSPGQARTLPPGRREPTHPHRDRYRPGYPGNMTAPTIVIDGSAFLTPAAAKKAVAHAPSSSIVHAQQQDQFDSWSTEKP